MTPADQSSAAAFAFAHERCVLIRNTSFVQTLARARANGIIPPGVALTPISPQALREHEAQWTDAHWTGAGGWQWNLLTHRDTRKPRSFHAALWSGPRRCGLCEAARNYDAACLRPRALWILSRRRSWRSTAPTRCRKSWGWARNASVDQRPTWVKASRQGESTRNKDITALRGLGAPWSLGEFWGTRRQPAPTRSIRSPRSRSARMSCGFTLPAARSRASCTRRIAEATPSGATRDFFTSDERSAASSV